MDHPLRRNRLAARLPDLEVEAVLVTRLPNVRYLTGFTGSNAQLLLAADGARFFTDGRYTEQSRREVPDVERTTYAADFGASFTEAAAELGVSKVGFEAHGMTYRSWQQLAEKASGTELVPVGEEVEQLRWVKEPAEIALLDRAQAITDDAFDRIVAKLVEGVTETDVALELEWIMRQGGAEGLAFESIVAFGESSAEPHHHPGGRQLKAGDVVKMDFGARFEGYHADMTRTVAFGEPPAELREIYDLVKRSQQAGVDAAVAGSVGKDVDKAARDIIAEAGFAEAFSHSLGHGVGLEVHEGPSFRSLSEEVIPVGAVITVEPGVYVPGLGGVRIEDMVEITADGPRVLPRSTKDLVVL
jgi:Xaa-Pro aminopeptidase